MSRLTVFAHTDPVSPRCEDEFNRWYDEVHIPELIVPGVLSVRRYRIAPVSAARPAHRYLAAFELDESQGAMAAMMEAAARSTPSDAIASDRSLFHIYEPVFAWDRR